MKKFLSALIIVMLMSVSAYAASNKIGVLAKLNMTEEEYQNVIQENRASGKSQKFTSSISPEGESYVYYDNLISLLMGLNAGDVAAIEIPEDVANYVMNMNDGYKIAGIIRMTTNFYLSFGFRAGDNPELLKKFNEALLSMKLDGTISILQDKYIFDAGYDVPEPVKFEHFDNVKDKIKVAVTGDMPPIDFVTASGVPAGFNTAVLAEIGKRLKINIELVDIDAGARTAALASKRVDAVFWFMTLKDEDKHPDVPKEIALSEPYYSWNEMLSLVKK